jgi:hypothetical protein
MNTQNEEQKTIALLGSQKGLMPSEDLLHATLRKLSSSSVVKSPYLSLIQKFSLAAAAILVFAGGGAFYAFHNQANSTVPAASSVTPGNSDAALAADLSSVDAQMNGLSSDTAAADNALNKTGN